MCWEGRYSTHIHISVIWFWKKRGRRGKGQDTVISPAPIHLDFNGRHHCVHIVMKEANLVHLELGTRFCTGHRQVPRILFESSFKVLFPHDYPQVFLFSTEMAVWQNSVPRCNVYNVIQFKHEDYASTHNPACLLERSTFSSTVHLPPHAYSLKRNNHPYGWRSLLHPNVFEIFKKHGVIFS